MQGQKKLVTNQTGRFSRKNAKRDLLDSDPVASITKKHK
jgi:hypothetical protein